MSANDNTGLFICRLERLNQQEKKVFVCSSDGEQAITELFLVTEGYLVRECNENTIRINRHDSHLSTTTNSSNILEYSADVAGWYCRFKAISPDNTHLWDDVKKETEWISSFLYEYPLRLNKRVAERLGRNLQTIYDLSQEYSIAYPLLQPYLVVCIAELRMQLRESDPESYLSRAFQITSDYRELLEQHFAHEFRLSFYATQLGISPNHLNKSVRLATGNTASDLLNKLRLREAKRLLTETSHSIAEIAFSLGFEDDSYFIRFFRKQEGITPLNHRKRSKNE